MTAFAGLGRRARTRNKEPERENGFPDAPATPGRGAGIFDVSQSGFVSKSAVWGQRAYELHFHGITPACIRIYEETSGGEVFWKMALFRNLAFDPASLCPCPRAPC